jgi:hypothetical protein
MANATKQGMAHEIQAGRLRVLGMHKANVIQLLSRLTEQHGRSWPSLKEPITVLLDKNALESADALSRKNGTLILNLESLELVRASNEHPGAIRWFSQTDPRELVGPLLDHYRGTYFRGYRRELIYSSDTDTEIYSLSPNIEMTGALAAAICAAREAGVPKSEVALHLAPQTKTMTSRHESALEGEIA